MSKIASFGRLPWDEKLAAMEAFVMLSWARFLIKLVPVKMWQSHMAVSARNPATVSLTERERKAGKLVARMIKMAVRNAPVELVCLPQALAARWMLRRRGIESDLSIGTKLGEAGDRDFHAWLKVQELWITGHCNEADYAVFAPQKRMSE
jgi:hypothetical protein